VNLEVQLVQLLTSIAYQGKIFRSWSGECEERSGLPSGTQCQEQVRSCLGSSVQRRHSAEAIDIGDKSVF
jgi:hypothetical protein